MPRKRLGSKQLKILRVLNQEKRFWDVNNLLSHVGFSQKPYYTLDSLEERDLIKRKEIAGIESVKITKRGSETLKIHDKRSQFDPRIKRIDVGENYYHVRIREPHRFSKIRIPDYASKISSSISKGSKVKMGKNQVGNWLVQSILIRRSYHDIDQTQDLALRILKRIEDS